MQWGHEDDTVRIAAFGRVYKRVLRKSPHNAVSVRCGVPFYRETGAPVHRSIPRPNSRGEGSLP